MKRVSAESADLFLEFAVLLLGMDEVKDDVECACEDEGKEEGEACEVGITLRAEKWWCCCSGE